MSDTQQETETPTPSWAVETMMLINKLTPQITDKKADPDWFLLRQRFEAIERENVELRKRVEELHGQINEFTE